MRRAASKEHEVAENEPEIVFGKRELAVEKEPEIVKVVQAEEPQVTTAAPPLETRTEELGDRVKSAPPAPVATKTSSGGEQRLLTRLKTWPAKPASSTQIVFERSQLTRCCSMLLPREDLKRVAVSLRFNTLEYDSMDYDHFAKTLLDELLRGSGVVIPEVANFRVRRCEEAIIATISGSISDMDELRATLKNKTVTVYGETAMVAEVQPEKLSKLPSASLETACDEMRSEAPLESAMGKQGDARNKAAQPEATPASAVVQEEVVVQAPPDEAMAPQAAASSAAPSAAPKATPMTRQLEVVESAPPKLVEGGKPGMAEPRVSDEAPPKVRKAGKRQVEILVRSAADLRNADWSVARASNSDPYCVCQIKGKKGKAVKKKTKVISDTQFPEWNQTLLLEGCEEGDTLGFHVWDSDLPGKRDDSLGYTDLESSMYFDDGFDGELALKECGKGHNATLQLKVVVL